jgi:hypothetical protein
MNGGGSQAEARTKWGSVVQSAVWPWVKEVAELFIVSAGQISRKGQWPDPSLKK